MGLGNARRSLGDHFLGALQFRDFRTLWSANLFAGSAAWALIVARGWEAFSLSDSSVWVGLVTFAAMIPLFLATPIVGVLADRFDRRTLLAASFATNLVHNLVLATLAVTGALELWHLVVLAFVNGTGRSMALPTAQSLLPNLVPRERLANAIALNQATQHGSRLTGPLLILPLVITVGTAGAFFLCTALYAAGLVQVLRIRTASTGVIDPQKGVLGNMMAGVSYVYRRPLLLSVILLVAVHCSLTMSFESVLPVLSRDALGAGSQGTSFSLLMIGFGAGALVVAVALAGMQREATRGRALLVTGIGSGLAPIGLAVAPNVPVAMLATAGMGVTQAGFMLISLTMVQTMVPDGVRGRVTSLYLWHIGGVMAATNLINGAVADVVGAPLVLSVTGVAFVVVSLVSLTRLPLRELYFRGAPAAATAA